MQKCVVCNCEEPPYAMKGDTCRFCVRYGLPNALNVPYKAGDIIHIVGSPRTPYKVLEVLPATLADRRGGVRISYAGRANRTDVPWVQDNPSVIEWRKTNIKLPAKDVLDALVAGAETMWRDRANDYLRRKGDQGTCVIGAEIRIYGVMGETVRCLPAPGGQGCLTWEDSVQDVLDFLRGEGLDATYYSGRMD